MTGTICKSRADVLEEVQCFYLYFARAALCLVCGHTVSKSVLCQEAGDRHLDHKVTLLKDFRLQLTSLSEKGESIDIESLLAPFLDVVQKILFDISKDTNRPSVVRELQLH